MGVQGDRRGAGAYSVATSCKGRGTVAKSGTSRDAKWELAHRSVEAKLIVDNCLK